MTFAAAPVAAEASTGIASYAPSSTTLLSALSQLSSTPPRFENVAFTRDQMPHAGVLDDIFYAGGYCGHGIAMATHMGLAIARRIAGETVSHPFVDASFAPIPFYNGRPWFLPLVGAWYRVLDWWQ